MDAGELGTGLLLTGLGGGLLWVLWRCWSGRWRGWVGQAWLDALVLGVGPPAGLITAGAGLAVLLPDPVGALVGAPLLLVGLVLVPVGLVAILLPRRWWGPRWYRRLTDDEFRALATARRRARRPPGSDRLR